MQLGNTAPSAANYQRFLAAFIAEPTFPIFGSFVTEFQANFILQLLDHDGAFGSQLLQAAESLLFGK